MKKFYSISPIATIPTSPAEAKRRLEVFEGMLRERIIRLNIEWIISRVEEVEQPDLIVEQVRWEYRNWRPLLKGPNFGKPVVFELDNLLARLAELES